MSALAEYQSTELTQPSINGYGRMIEMAVQTGDLDKVERMMELQERWEQQQAKKAYDHAISRFKSNAPTLIKNKRAHNSAYADLAQVVAKATPILSEYGLSSGWKTQTEPTTKTVSVTCNLCHIDGHYESVTMSEMYDESGNKNRIQAMASAVSYLERYTFMAITGLAARGMDDDGNDASQKPQQTISPLQSYMLSGDALGVFLYSRTLDEIQNDQEKINRWTDELRAPEGFKGAVKDNWQAMHDAGLQLYDCIIQAAIDEEPGMLHECFEGALKGTKAMLKTTLSPEQWNTIVTLMKQVQA